jgi:hypothetical protein
MVIAPLNSGLVRSAQLAGGQLAFFAFHGVEADGGRPQIHAHPGRRGCRIAHGGAHLGQVPGRIGLQHALLVQQHQRGGGHAPDHIGLGIGFFGQQARSDDAGAVAHKLQLDLGMGFFKAAL